MPLATPGRREEPWGAKARRLLEDPHLAASSILPARNHQKRGRARRAKRDAAGSERKCLEAYIRSSPEDEVLPGAPGSTRRSVRSSCPGDGGVWRAQKQTLTLAEKYHLVPHRVAESHSTKVSCVDHDMSRLPGEVQGLCDRRRRPMWSGNVDSGEWLPDQLVAQFGVYSPATAPCAEFAFVCEGCMCRRCSVHHADGPGTACSKCRAVYVCCDCAGESRGDLCGECVPRAGRRRK